MNKLKKVVESKIKEEMNYIGTKIETELKLAQVLPETQRQICKIAERLVSEEHVQAIVLGCTELPLILNDTLISVPCLDVMKLHIEKLISLILEQ